MLQTRGLTELQCAHGVVFSKCLVFQVEMGKWREKQWQRSISHEIHCSVRRTQQGHTAIARKELFFFSPALILNSRGYRQRWSTRNTTLVSRRWYQQRY